MTKIASLTVECELKRYAAYFSGWCQAFGEFDQEFVEEDGITWLLGSEQVGLILPEQIRRKVYRTVLGKKGTPSRLTVSNSYFEIGQTRFELSNEQVQDYMSALLGEFRQCQVLHLYLTYHLTYPSGTRFVTLSKKAPVRIIYKEIEPMTICIE